MKQIGEEYEKTNVDGPSPWMNDLAKQRCHY